MMKCPICSSDMRMETVANPFLFEGSAIYMSYAVYVCDGCGNKFIDSSSLKEALDKAFEQLDTPSAQDLKRAREALGITVEELADVFDKSESLILKIESGDRRPSSKMLSLYSKYVISGPAAFANAVEIAFKEGIISKGERDAIMGKLLG